MANISVIGTSLLTLALCAGPVRAGVYGDDLGKCLVESSTTEDKRQLTQWIFFAIALNPDIKPYANIPPGQRDQANKGMARLFEKLLGESCLKQAQQAVKYEGPSAFSDSFRLLGQVAGQEIFASPEVAAGTAEFASELHVEDLQEKLGFPVK